MRTGMLFPFLLFASLVRAQDVDILHYTFVLHLTNNNDSINGYTEITFWAKENTKGLSLDLTNVGTSGKGMKVVNVQLMQPQKRALEFRHENDKLIVPLSLAEKGDSATIAVWYKGIPGDGLIIGRNKYGDRNFFADNWPNRAHNWIPCNDKPDDKASFEFIVHAPSHYNVVSNGIKVEEKEDNGMKLTHWQEDTPLPTKVMVIGVAKFAVKVFDDSPKDVPVSAWVYPQDSAKGFYDYALATNILKFFSGYIAAYPYKKLANVQSKTIFGGMENASCIFYAESSVTGDRSEEDLYAHEIAHQWFGDMASEKSFAHLWLSEGFATYMTDVYFEHKYGREAFLKRLLKERTEAIAFAKTSTHSVVDSTTNLMSLLNANSYQKGAWVLHMLRQEVGDSVFHKIIQAYYNSYKGGNADTRDFETVAEKVSGKELKPFFDQWLYRAGVPQINFRIYQEKALFRITIKQKSGEIFAFPLEMEVLGADGQKKKFTASVTGEEQTFTYSLGFPVKSLTLDPDGNLLYEEIR